ncbi:putative glyoxalase superfamily protein PhnB [Saccharothrix saharensis]|uniref:Putative glyoxalase superfamily protein PhnB n=1 Tax=Saccharothrix saharensis TaxID=571190 RepID=A0A543J9J3_9PSEU|nr:VOC family protein [Saccharothrix saharensis]TQM79489.1 putative glyoxalase superfamily protein PhnB [Saccharothrix saharensis]
MNVVPDGYHTVTPWIITAGRTAELIDFTVAVLDGVELGRVEADGVVGHAEVRVGDSVVMMFDRPGWPATPAFLRLYVADDAEVLRRAVARGSVVVTEPTELFWGDRVSRLRDPFGNLWWVHQRVAEPTQDELPARMADPAFVAAMAYVQSADFSPAG